MATQLWRAVSVYRVITLAYAALLILRYDRLYAHPGWGLAALAVMTGWTAVTVIAYSFQRRPGGAGASGVAPVRVRFRWLIAADLCVAMVMVESTRWIDSPARIAVAAPTIPVMWAAAPVLACAVAGGPWWGLAGGAALCAADFAEHPNPAVPSPSSVYGAVLVLLVGGIGGYVVRLVLTAERDVQRAARREAAVAERERIARHVHDSVLQVLTLMTSRGAALGGEAAELGRLAGEQEAALRALLAADELAADGLAAGSGLPGAGLSGAAGTEAVDLRPLAEKFGSAAVTVSCPATPVMLAAGQAGAIAGAVAAALDNVRAHAGPGARAWVLVEDGDGGAGNAGAGDAGVSDTGVTVSVRDDGKGFAPGRLTEAAASGRLGVSQSIVGRMRAAGGTASVTSAPGEGTEVELRVPRS